MKTLMMQYKIVIGSDAIILVEATLLKPLTSEVSNIEHLLENLRSQHSFGGYLTHKSHLNIVSEIIKPPHGKSTSRY